MAFEKYKQIPEYHLVNQGMGIEDFKFIFWWEWSHRFLGRFIGVAFALPLLAFWWRQAGCALGWREARGAAWRSVACKAASAGTWSRPGSSDRVDVSQYRLALHFSVAMCILARDRVDCAR